jgi:AcrR family transcriptional regulator
MTTYSSSEITKRKIIFAAGELAAEGGIDNVSTRAVADFSGENIGSIHYHFGGKQGLWEEVVREAMLGCVQLGTMEELDELEKEASPQKFSKMIRKVISDEISALFRSDRPDWYAKVTYQLMQREDKLYELFRKGRLDPNMDFLDRLISMIKPELDNEEVFIIGCLMSMPIFSHSSYRPAMFKRLKIKEYSGGYLQKMEDLLVRQVQLLLGLPQDDESCAQITHNNNLDFCSGEAPLLVRNDS